jgi:hypothetical protein
MDQESHRERGTAGVKTRTTAAARRNTGGADDQNSDKGGGAQARPVTRANPTGGRAAVSDQEEQSAPLLGNGHNRRRQRSPPAKTTTDVNGDHAAGGSAKSFMQVLTGGPPAMVRMTSQSQALDVTETQSQDDGESPLTTQPPKRACHGRSLRPQPRQSRRAAQRDLNFDAVESASQQEGASSQEWQKSKTKTKPPMTTGVASTRTDSDKHTATAAFAEEVIEQSVDPQSSDESAASSDTSQSSAATSASLGSMEISRRAFEMSTRNSQSTNMDFLGSTQTFPATPNQLDGATTQTATHAVEATMSSTMSHGMAGGQVLQLDGSASGQATVCMENPNNACYVISALNALAAALHGVGAGELQSFMTTTTRAMDGWKPPRHANNEDMTDQQRVPFKLDFLRYALTIIKQLIGRVKHSVVRKARIVTLQKLYHVAFFPKNAAHDAQRDAMVFTERFIEATDLVQSQLEVRVRRDRNTTDRKHAVVAHRLANRFISIVATTRTCSHAGRDEAELRACVCATCVKSGEQSGILCDGLDEGKGITMSHLPLVVVRKQEDGVFDVDKHLMSESNHKDTVEYRCTDRSHTRACTSDTSSREVTMRVQAAHMVANIARLNLGGVDAAPLRFQRDVSVKITDEHGVHATTKTYAVAAVFWFPSFQHARRETNEWHHGVANANRERGHYTTAYLASDGQWYHQNDDWQAQRINIEHAVSNVVMMHYVKDVTTNNLPPPPPPTPKNQLGMGDGNDSSHGLYRSIWDDDDEDEDGNEDEEARDGARGGTISDDFRNLPTMAMLNRASVNTNKFDRLPYNNASETGDQMCALLEAAAARGATEEDRLRLHSWNVLGMAHTRPRRGNKKKKKGAGANRAFMASRNRETLDAFKAGDGAISELFLKRHGAYLRRCAKRAAAAAAGEEETEPTGDQAIRTRDRIHAEKAMLKAMKHTASGAFSKGLQTLTTRPRAARSAINTEKMRKYHPSPLDIAKIRHTIDRMEEELKNKQRQDNRQVPQTQRGEDQSRNDGTAHQTDDTLSPNEIDKVMPTTSFDEAPLQVIDTTVAQPNDNQDKQLNTDQTMQPGFTLTQLLDDTMLTQQGDDGISQSQNAGNQSQVNEPHMEHQDVTLTSQTSDKTHTQPEVAAAQSMDEELLSQIPDTPPSQLNKNLAHPTQPTTTTQEDDAAVQRRLAGMQERLAQGENSTQEIAETASQTPIGVGTQSIGNTVTYLIADTPTEQSDVEVANTSNEKESNAPRMNAEMPPPPRTGTARKVLEEMVDKDAFHLLVEKTINKTASTSSSGLAEASWSVIKQFRNMDPRYAAAHADYIRALIEGRGFNHGVNRAAHTGASLNATDKKDGGIRPLTVGCASRRTTSSVAAELIKQQCKDYFEPTQLGVGAIEGCPRVVHFFRQLGETNKHNTDFAKVKVDLSNAFNNVSRAAFRYLVGKFAPWLSPWVEYLYGDDSDLLFGDVLIKSREGTHQGDPLAPMLFALVVHLIVLELDEKVPGLQANKWFLDDGALAGDAESLVRAIAYLMSEEARSLGLFLNPGKCELIFLNEEAENNMNVIMRAGDVPARENENAAAVTLQSNGGLVDNQDVVATSSAEDTCRKPDDVMVEVSLQHALGIRDDKVFRDGNYTLLGSPIGDPAWCADYIRKSAGERNVSVLQALSEVPDTQTAFALMRNCAGFCKVNHLIRTVPPSPEVDDALAEFQLVMRGVVSAFGITFNDEQWRQLQLPIGMGGIGTRNPSRHHPAAYLASLSYAMQTDGFDVPDAHLASTIERYNASIDPEASQYAFSRWDKIALGDFERLTIESIRNERKQQGNLSAWASISDLAALLSERQDETEDGESQAQRRLRILSLQGPSAGAYLIALPNAALGTKMTSGAFVTAIELRIGGKIGDEFGHDCPECLEAIARGGREAPEMVGRYRAVPAVDAYGYHALCSCKYGGDKLKRHNALLKPIARAGKAAGFTVRTETRSGGKGKQRPGDVELWGGQPGDKGMVIDATICFGAQQKFINNIATMQIPSSTADAAAEGKNKKYKTQIEQSPVSREFIALAVNHWGAWATESLAFIIRLGERVGLKSTGSAVETRATSLLLQQLSVALHVANHAIIFRRRSAQSIETRWMIEQAKPLRSRHQSHSSVSSCRLL